MSAPRPGGCLETPGGVARLLEPVKLWNYMRKGDLVVALRAGLLTVAEVKAAHDLADDELAAWQAAYDRGGVDALRLTPRGMRRVA